MPISNWTLVALVAGCLVSVPLAKLLSARTGWGRNATLTTVMLLAASLAITLTPGEDSGVHEFHPCLTIGTADPIDGLLRSGGGLGGTLLNALLLLPLTCAATLATRRALPMLLFAFLLPALIEPLQTLIPGRYCSLSDQAANTVGAVLGVALGYLLRRASRHGSDDATPKQAHDQGRGEAR
ncbi:VanZ family protein [Amycolatopsis keratiniphila]|uniref:VanZ family protein n=1 Tax=Amycolatopsis keratiniphila TaxID=129921 RepID=UPI001E339191|nr:VanZ family protein [Amycolatopsis keratiniphila]